MGHHLRRSLILASITVVALLGTLAGPAAASGARVSIVASGLDNPRGIAIGREGKVFVAVAGEGGTGPGGYGRSGKIVVIDDGHARTYRGGLPSIMSPEGETSGPVGVSVSREGKVYAVVGGGPQDVNKRFASLLRVSREGSRILADIGGYQVTDPDPTDLDMPPNPTESNPYGIAALKHGRVLVTDAAGDDLLLVKRSGKVETVARFPNQVISTSSLPPVFGVPPGLNLPAEAVPTSVAVGPDGYWYVGELKGFPFEPGKSRIWRIAPWARGVTCDPTAKSGDCTLFMDGFTSIVSLTFGSDGSLYVVEIVKKGVANLFAGTDTVGALWKVTDGVRTELVPGRLTVPGGVAVTKRGTIYVTNKSVAVNGGEVLRIKP
jgi:hypothetical protein